MGGCYLLGVFYARAKGVEYDEERARALLKRACDGGFQRACKLL